MQRTPLAPALLAAALLALFTGLARPAAAETLLTLSETASVRVAPDRIVASLRAEAQATSAAVAQTDVNRQITAALAAARAVKGVGVSTGYYSVWHLTQPTDQWHATETVMLRGADGKVVLALVGRLQSAGMALSQLGWTVAPATERRARLAATSKALSRLTARAQAAAKLLGLRFVSFKDVRLDPVTTALPGPRFTTMGAAAPAPQAGGQPADIAATVAATAILLPAQP